MIKASIIGATGYAGAELFRLLSVHPNVTVNAISSVSFEGKNISEIYAGFRDASELTLTNADDAISDSDVVFASLPHGLSEKLAESCLKKNIVLIDLGADFRLECEKDYLQWYKKPFDVPAIHSCAVYALPELFREKIKDAKIIANPGCYPTAAALGIAPAIKHGFVEIDNIIIDAKSGVTGAGRSLAQNTHYPEANESLAAYKAGTHRHTPEIEQTLSHIADKKVNVTFVPHLLPVNRGIEETIYCKLKGNASLDDIRAAYLDMYKDEYFVHVEPDGEYAAIHNVRLSNFADISIHADLRTGTLIICSAIDNMVKGAAGQAIQNMNIRFGFDEKLGINMLPAVF